MELYNLENGAMINKGASALKNLPPVLSMLDLFVRESLQNSLDAKQKNKNNVIVEFNYGEFDNEGLANLVDHKILSKRMRKKGLTLNNFISIKDLNTTGLEGPVLNSEVKNNDEGKFLGLIKNFGISNKEKDSGGSWGYGKATYYKLGIGLVLFYSRIKNDKNEFEERLMGCIIENEMDQQGLLYEIQNSNTGIAWLGKMGSISGKTDILPITSHREIMDVLNCFNLKPFEDKETGTTVIIPYIDEIDLLNNTSNSNLEEGNIQNWCRSIPEYLKMSVQKWYPTKINNDEIKNYLVVYINDEKLENYMLYPVFNIVRNLYNSSVKDAVSGNIKREKLSYKNKPYYLQKKEIATLYYIEATKEELKMVGDYSYCSPIKCISNLLNDDNEGNVLLCFCRKPGMIIRYSYNNSNDKWSRLISKVDPEKYFIGLIVPNSENEINIENKIVTIEEYLRASENSVHNNWEDINEFTFYKTGETVDVSMVNIVKRISGEIETLFNNNKKTQNIGSLNCISKELSDKLTNLFMPGSNFGKLPKKSSAGGAGGGSGTGGGTRKTKIDFYNTEFYPDYIEREFKIDFTKSEKNIKVCFEIESEAENVNINNWEEDGFNFPIVIKDVVINKIIYDSNIEKEVNEVFNNSSTKNDITFEQIKSKNNTIYGFSLEVDEIYSLEGKIRYQCIDPSIRVTISKGDK